MEPGPVKARGRPKKKPQPIQFRGSQSGVAAPAPEASNPSSSKKLNQKRVSERIDNKKTTKTPKKLKEKIEKRVSERIANKKNAKRKTPKASNPPARKSLKQRIKNRVFKQIANKKNAKTKTPKASNPPARKKLNQKIKKIVSKQIANQKTAKTKTISLVPSKISIGYIRQLFINRVKSEDSNTIPSVSVSYSSRTLTITSNPDSSTTTTTMQPNRPYTVGYNTAQPNQNYQRAMFGGNVYPHPHQYQAPQKPVAQPTLQYPVHPDVKLKRLPFYDHVGELIKPSSLVPQGNQRQQEGTFMFHLTPAQANAIGVSRDMRPGNRVDYLTQVQLRFCLLETTSEQEDCFPPGIIVKVNQKMCPLPNPIPPNKPGMEPKRPPRPVNITSLVKISPVVSNTIQVCWNTDYSRGYVLAVHLVHKRTSEELLQRMKTKGVRAADYTRGMIKDKLKEDGEIATTSLRVSIACPLGKMRMTTPCRASTCNHFQCFDASLFLQMNEKKPQWMCPVCNKPAVYDKLVIDGYFQDVLLSNKLPADCSEIQLYMDGSWAPLVIEKKEQSCILDKETPMKIKSDVKVDSSTALSIVQREEKNSDVTIVTLSDSDDEPLVPKKKAIESAPGSAKPEPVQSSQQKPKPQDSPGVIVLDEDSPVASPVSSTAACSSYTTTVENPFLGASYRYPY